MDPEVLVRLGGIVHEEIGMSEKQSPATFITRLFETHLTVKNLERSMQFYGDVLGLKLALKEGARRAAFYWLGEPRNTMLGIWENPPWAAEERPGTPITIQHIAFETEFGDLGHVIGNLKERGIQLRNFFDEITEQPSVFGWIPAASIYFSDPDGHLLEFIAKLPGEAKPEIEIVSLAEWSATGKSSRS
jgi:lactoylglutathione lyase